MKRLYTIYEHSSDSYLYHVSDGEMKLSSEPKHYETLERAKDLVDKLNAPGITNEDTHFEVVEILVMLREA